MTDQDKFCRSGFDDAVIVIPWVVYRFYGDKRIIKDNYKAMTAWFAYIKNKTIGHLYTEKGYGDWNSLHLSQRKTVAKDGRNYRKKQ